MAIYTRFGMRVKVTEARMIPVWIERLPSEIRWHYAPKKATRRTKELREEPVWHIKATYDHGDDMDGALVCDGKWMALDGFVADNGIRELHEHCHTLNCDDLFKFAEWRKANGPKASELYKLEPKNNIA